MYNLAIRKCISPPHSSPKVENFQMKISYPGPADLLPSEPARRAVRILLFLCILDLKNREHTTFQINWTIKGLISFLDNNILINFNINSRPKFQNALCALGLEVKH